MKIKPRAFFEAAGLGIDASQGTFQGFALELPSVPKEMVHKCFVLTAVLSCLPTGFPQGWLQPQEDYVTSNLFDLARLLLYCVFKTVVTISASQEIF